MQFQFRFISLPVVLFASLLLVSCGNDSSPGDENTPPVAGDDVSISIDEGAETLTGQLTSIDPDEDATANFSISAGNNTPAGFVLNSDGSFSFDPEVPTYEHLNVGASEVLTIPVTVTDDQGATDTTQIQITVNGTNDAPVAGDSVTASVDEGGVAILIGQLTSTDLDDSATETFSVSVGNSAPVGFVLNSDGSFSFNPVVPTYEHLNVGDSDVLIIPVTVADDQGATDVMQIQITVNGTNDAPVAGDSITASVDVTAAMLIGLLTSSDIDDGATAAFSITGGASAPAGFVLNVDGSFSFDPADIAYASLNMSDSQLLTIVVTVTDDQGATDSMQIQITVTGTNNAPVAADDSYDTYANTLLEVGVTASGSIAVIVSGSLLDNDSDLDVADVLTVSLDTAPISGSVIIDTLGNFSYVPLAGLSSVTDSFSYRVSDGSSSDSATVSINISDDLIWYVDNRSGGGSGTSDDPFATLLQTESVTEDGDTLYIANGDGSTTGLDNGLTVIVPNISIIGEGEALVINGVTLAVAGIAPTLTDASGDGITLNNADNTLIMGLTIDAVSGDGLVINNSIGVLLDGITISNSGESAIQGSGDDVELTLIDVIIDTVDIVDSTVSDDAIFIASTSSSSLVMSGGSINDVPGNLGNGIKLENIDAANVVSIMLDVRGVNFSDIGQDGINLNNKNGVLDVQIGGATNPEGNIFDVGFRGIHIRTDADPTLSRTNRIQIQQNNITSVNEGIQIRAIDDSTNLSVLDNTLTLAPNGNFSDLIDVQSELMASMEARINGNNISNVAGGDGIKVRVFDEASLTMEVMSNLIDGPDEGLDFDVIETNALSINPTALNVTVLNNTLLNIGSQAMNARNANTSSNICLDLQGNSTVADYVLDAVVGSFALTAVSQLIVFDPPAGNAVLGNCPVPLF